MDDILVVMSYNVQCIPWYLAPGYSVWTRSRILPKFLVEIVTKYSVDVLILQECFDKNVFNSFKNALHHLLPYSTNIIGCKNEWDSTMNNSNFWMKLVNGGVCILSRYPILYRHQLIFKNCRNTCSFSSKGACLAVINKGNKRVNVIGTHLQAYDGPSKAVRQRQFVEITQWLKTLDVNTNDPYILAGDLNTCCITDTHEFNTMLSNANFIKFTHTFDLHKDPTYCCLTNDYCKMCNVESMSTIYDYILAGPGVKVIQPQTVIHDKLESPMKLRKYYLFCIGTHKMEIYNPSDHYPIYSTLAI